MGVILYSTGCPKCNVLKKKLEMKKIEYIEDNNVEKLIEMGIKQAPVLDVDGEMLGFAEANKWINSWKKE